MNAKALSIMRYQDDINTEHSMKLICRATVAQWTKRLTRNVLYMRVFDTGKAQIFFYYNTELPMVITHCYYHLLLPMVMGCFSKIRPKTLNIQNQQVKVH